MFNEITKPYYLLALTKTNKYSNIETFTNTSTSNTNSNNNEEEASYFELQCLHNISETLIDSIKRFCHYIELHSTSPYHSLIPKLIKVYLLIINYTSLYYQNATLSESFFGFQRVSLNTNSNESLQMSHRLYSILIQVISKCYDLIDKNSILSRFLNITKIVVIYKTISLLYHVRFLYRLSNSNNIPVYNATNIYLPEWKWLNYRLIKKSIGGNYSYSMSISIIIMILIKFLQYYSQEQSQKPQETISYESHISYPKPHPSQLFTKDNINISNHLSSKSNTCRLCKQKILSPCLSTGGYIFCYSCLIKYVQQYNSCPVTNMYCNVSSIIKLFDSNDK